MSARRVDMIGKKFGRWTVLRRGVDTKSGRTAYVVRCRCGSIKTVEGSALSSGDSKSCGCLQRELASKKIARVHAAWVYKENPNPFRHRRDDTTSIEIKSHGKTYQCIIDTAVFPSISTRRWCIVWVKKTPYVTDSRKSKSYLQHEICGSRHVIHVDRDTLNCTRVNLMKATPLILALHRRKSPGGSSKYRGVSWSKPNHYWRTRFKSVWIGNFPDEVRAAVAYDEYICENYGDKYPRLMPYALNFPNDHVIPEAM